MSLFGFRIKNGVLLKYAGDKENIIIPDNVTIIGEGAFRDKCRVKTVQLHDRITSIEKNAFYGAEKLERINFPDSLKIIRENAFKDCFNLKEVIFPDNGIEIEKCAFLCCRGLERIIIPDSVKLNTFVFENCDSVRYVVSCKSADWLFPFQKNVTVITNGEYKKTHVKEETVDTDNKVEPDLHLRHFTRAGLPLKDKKYIFLHCAARDYQKAEKIVQDILAFENGINYAIWISDNPKAVPFEENRTEIERMSVFVPLVTSAYLDMAKEFGIDSDGKCSFSLEKLNKEVTVVVPVFLESNLANDFNKLFGDLQGIDVRNTRLQLSLETHLENILGDTSLNNEILQDGFSREYFLSYRKKDRDDALRIMRSVHNTEVGYGAAIWFDDFLVPGENFNDQINDNMINSDAVILSVTPSILEEGNYVKEIEYKNASSVKEVIPVEAVATDRAGLEMDYEGLEQCIDVEDEELLNERLGRVSYKKATKKYEPHDIYLIARAFLAGFHVEKDIDRGLKLLKKSAEQNDINACLHMGFLFLSGRGVQRDLNETVYWYKKAWALLKDKHNLDRMYELLFGMDGLVLILQSRNKVGEANDLCREFIKILNDTESSTIDVDDKKLWEGWALNFISDIHFDISPSSKRIEEALESGEKMIKLLNNICGKNYNESKALLGSAYGNCARIYLIKGDVSLAEKYYQKAIDIFNTSGVLDIKSIQEFKKVFAGLLGEYGLLQRELAIQQSFSNPSRSIELLRPAVHSLTQAYIIELNLTEQDPTINNREGLATALYNLALVSENKSDAQDNLKRAQDIVQKLQEETKDGSFDDFAKDIKSLMKKRRFF